MVLSVAVFFSLIAWDYLVQHGQWSRGVLLSTWVAATILLPLTFGWVRRSFVRMGHWGAPLIIIGARGAAQRLIRLMSNNPKLGYVPVGILDLDSGLAGTELNGVPVVGGVRGAGYWAKRVKTAAVAMPELEGTQLAQMSARLPFPQVLLLPEYQGIQTSWISTRDLNGVLGLEVKKKSLAAPKPDVEKGDRYRGSRGASDFQPAAAVVRLHRDHDRQSRQSVLPA